MNNGVVNSVLQVAMEGVGCLTPFCSCMTAVSSAGRPRVGECNASRYHQRITLSGGVPWASTGHFARRPLTNEGCLSDAGDGRLGLW